nr:hypothetical protein BgiMline_002296 [Biomphalaria glabrata]
MYKYFVESRSSWVVLERIYCDKQRDDRQRKKREPHRVGQLTPRTPIFYWTRLLPAKISNVLQPVSDGQRETTQYYSININLKLENTAQDDGPTLQSDSIAIQSDGHTVMGKEYKVMGILYKLMGIEYKLMGIEYKVMAIEYKVMGIQHKVMGIEYKVMGIQHKVMGIRNKLMGIQHKVMGIE